VKRILIMSDTHCGHKSGLTPPAWQSQPPESAPHAVLKGAALRSALWNWFAARVAEFQPINYLLHLGDCIDGRGEKSGGVELLTGDREEQSRMAALCIQEVKATDGIYMVYGTPYHVGEAEDWENWVAREVKANKIEAEGHYEVNGLRIAAKHFVGNSASPASKYTALSSAQVKQLLWAELGQQDRADLILRGHVHRYARVEDEINCAAVCPPLQGLGSRFGVRQRDGLPVSFGFLIADIESPQQWGLRKVLLPLAEQRGEVNRL
jgi:predicted phosphodiesterase